MGIVTVAVFEGMLIPILLFLPRISRWWYTRAAKRDPYRTDLSQVTRFEHLEHLFNRSQDAVLYRLLKIGPLPRPEMAPEEYEQLLKHPDADDEAKFYIYTKLARGAFRTTDYQKAAAYLDKALSLNPRDAVANARLAVTYERLDDGKHAVQYYQAAEGDPKNTNEIRNFFRREAQRVSVKGPRAASWLAGIRFGGA